MLFDGLMRQSEINRLLDELFGEPEGASLGEAKDVVFTLYEEGEWENAEREIVRVAAAVEREATLVAELARVLSAL